jgi:hypothetical protein
MAGGSACARNSAAFNLRTLFVGVWSEFGGGRRVGFKVISPTQVYNTSNNDDNFHTDTIGAWRTFSRVLSKPSVVLLNLNASFRHVMDEWV